MAEHGTFVWNHLVTPDQEKCGKFYCELFGWTRRVVDAGPFGIYTTFQRNGRDVAGMMNPTTDYTRSRPPSWYVTPISSRSATARSGDRSRHVRGGGAGLSGRG